MARSKKSALKGKGGSGPSKGPKEPAVSAVKDSQAQPCTEAQKQTAKLTLPMMAANQAAFSFGNNVAPPFFSYYLIRLGGNAFHLGIMQAFSYLFTNGLQLPSAYLSDRTGKRVPFIVAGIGISALVFLLITQFRDLWVIIILISIQAAAMSIYIPSWSALIGDEITCVNRGTILSEITEASIAAGLMGTVTSFLFLSMSPDKDANAFVLPFLAGAVSFFLAVVFILVIKETPAKKVERVLEFEKTDSKFLYMTKIQWGYNFFMSISWPLFPLTIAKVLGATNGQIAILTLISILTTAAFQPLAGKLLDRIGPVPMIQASRYVFVLVPFVYAFARDITTIYAWCIIEGIMAALINVSFISYILDSSPPDTRAEYFAYYNMGLGMVTFAGTILAGALVVLLQYYTSWTLAFILLVIYMVSGAGRIASSIPFAWLKDPDKNPSPPGQMAAARMELVRWLRRKH
jgi:MFS family permease